MSINIDELKKKIIYRSNYRGTKEMDKLLSSFTKKYIDTLDDIELNLLYNLLDLDDLNLLNFNQGKKIHINIEVNKVSNLFRNYIYNKD